MQHDAQPSTPPRAAPEPAVSANGPPGRGSPGFAKTTGIALLLAASLALFYRGALDLYFFHDDFVFLDRAQLSSPADLIDFFSLARNQRGLQDTSHSYRPLSTNFYFGIVQQAFGLEPRAFHAINLLALVGIGTMLAVLLVRLGSTPWVGAAAALVYAASSINYETQLWISVFQELSCALLVLAAVLRHVGFRQANRGGTTAVLGLYLAALLCKEMALALPAILLCWELVVRRSRPRAALAATLALWIATAVYLTARLTLLAIPSEGPYAMRPGWFALANLGTYAAWSWEALSLSSDWRPALALLVLAGVGLRFASPAARRLVAFGALWFLLALGPVLFMPEHRYRYYLVVPALGLAIAAAALVGTAAARLPRKRVRAGIAIVLVLAFTWLSHRRFEQAVARRERQTSRAHAILVQLRELRPVLPDHAQVYLSAPGNFALARFLKDSGAAIRVFYGNPTLRAYPLTRRIADDLGRGSAEPRLAFWFGEDGTLREHPENPR